ncbi:MAG: hypothetical protein M5T61_02940 [Acidimicrobiia bacterium]|nr:hypothetical protein [Acidimicrobiia bacterium]
MGRGHRATAGADVFRFGWDMGYVLYMVGFVTLGAALVAFGSAALRSERAKAWYSWSTVVLGVAMAISSLGILSSGVATAGLFTFLVLILWTLVGGILLIREA